MDVNGELVFGVINLVYEVSVVGDFSLMVMDIVIGCFVVEVVFV